MSFGDILIDKKKLLAITSVIVIVIAIIGFYISRAEFGVEEEFEVMIDVDKTIARIGETINFSAERCKGDIASYNWNFGDGNTSSEKSPSYFYEKPGWYNVSLVCTKPSSIEESKYVTIGIQRQDKTEIAEEGFKRALLPRNGEGFGTYLEIGPNIGNPTVDIKCEIYNPIGSMEFIITYWIYDDTASFGVIYGDTPVGTGNDIIIEYTVSFDELPIEIQSNVSDLVIDVYLFSGQWDGIKIVTNAVFPTDNLL